MIDHPKYMIQVAKYDTNRYVIFEHSSGERDGEEQLLSRVFGYYETFDKAIAALASLSEGPMILAYSAQAIDNKFDIRSLS